MGLKITILVSGIVSLLFVLYYAFIGATMVHGGYHAMGVVESYGPNHSRAVIFRAFTNGKPWIPDILMPVAHGEITLNVGMAKDAPEQGGAALFGRTK